MPGKVVTIFGSYAPGPEHPLYQLAYRIGYKLAEAGYAVCNGGYGGIMLASCKGAKDAGGRTIGVTCPSVFQSRWGPMRANEYVDEEIPAPDVLSRIEQMLRLGGGYVVLEGGTGTLSELGVVWEFVNKGFVPDRPICVVGSFWWPTIERITAARPGTGACIHMVEDPEQVVAVMNRHARRTSRKIRIGGMTVGKQAILPASGPQAQGPYSPAIRAGDFIFVSGQVPVDPATNRLVEGPIEQTARVALENLRRVLEAAGATLDDCVQVRVYLADMNDAPAMNRVYETFFSDPKPARATLQAGSLGKYAIEIEAVAYKPQV